VSYGVWIAARWNNDAAAVLPIYLLAIAVQCLHFTEEYPELFGIHWTDARFVTFNMLWLAAFVLAGLGVYREYSWHTLLFFFSRLSEAWGTAHLI
jgi:hypothetical protein